MGQFFIQGGKMEKILTEQGHLKIKKELDFLKKVRRKEIADRIRESQGFGDVSENSELDEAKNEQAFLEGKIQELEYTLKSSEIIKLCSGEKIEAGCRVLLLTESEHVEYTLVGSAETDPAQGKISVESPLGKALNGKRKGDKVSLDTISGPAEYKIVKIR